MCILGDLCPVYSGDVSLETLRVASGLTDHCPTRIHGAKAGPVRGSENLENKRLSSLAAREMKRYPGFYTSGGVLVGWASWAAPLPCAVHTVNRAISIWFEWQFLDLCVTVSASESSFAYVDQLPLLMGHQISFLILSSSSTNCYQAMKRAGGIASWKRVLKRRNVGHDQPRITVGVRERVLVACRLQADGNSRLV